MTGQKSVWMIALFRFFLFVLKRPVIGTIFLP